MTDINQMTVNCANPHRDINREKELYNAVKKGYVDYVRSLITEGVYVNYVSKKMKTPLYQAVSLCMHDMSSILIQHKADVNAQTSEGETPLFQAIENRNFDIFKLLVNSKADVHLCNKQGVSPLHIACIQRENLNIVESLIQMSVDVNTVTLNGTSPLHFACKRKENEDVVRFLISAGAIVHLNNKWKITPLRHAIWWGDDAMILLLLENGAHADDVGGEDGKPLLHSAVCNARSSKDMRKLTCILQYVKFKDVEDKDGNTALMFAAIQNGDDTSEGVRVLCDAGVRVDIQDSLGQTVLHHAVIKRQQILHNEKLAENTLSIIKKVIQVRQDLNFICGCKTVLEVLCRTGDNICFFVVLSATIGHTFDSHHVLDLYRLFSFNLRFNTEENFLRLVLDHYANTQVETGKITMMHLTLMFKHTVAAKHLIHSGIDLNIRDIHGRSLLYYAVFCRENSILELLLHRLPVDTHKEDAKEALIIAGQFGNSYAVKILLDYYSGSDALLTAIETDNVNAVDMLLKHHCRLPVDLRVRVRGSPKTKALLGTACLAFLACKPSKHEDCMIQNLVLDEFDLSTLIVAHTTGWSRENVVILRAYYEAQRGR